METQTNHSTATTRGDSQQEGTIPSTELFQPGTEVIYGLHGRCTLLGIETREIQGKSIAFYKLEIQKPALSRSTRKEPAIWLPVESATDQGLRLPITIEEAEAVLAVYENRDIFFILEESWNTVQPQLEKCIIQEGAVGLAKVDSYLSTLKRYLIVPTPEVTKMSETVHRHLLRELSEALGSPIRTLESKIQKGMRQKLGSLDP